MTDKANNAEGIKSLSNRVLFSGKADYSLPEIKEIKQKGGYLSYGVDNQYPKYLLNLFYNSALHNAIITGKVDYIAGKSLYNAKEDLNIKSFVDKCNTKGDSLHAILKRCALDYEIFGGFALQLVYGRADGKVAEIYYVDVSKLRYSLDGQLLKYSKDWAKPRVTIQEYESYDPNNPTGTQILYFNGHLSRDFYPIPIYIGTISAIETDIEIANFHLSNIKNGLFPGLSVDFKNGEPTEEEKEKIERAINEKWGGSSKAGRIMITFSDGAESAPSITPIEQPDLDKMFEVVHDTTKERIFTGHRVTTPILFGVQTPGKLGNTREFSEGYQIFQNTYIKPAQKTILSVFNQALSLNFPGIELQLESTEQLDTMFTDENIIGANMTKEEIRTKLKEWGYIETIEVEEKKADSLAVQIGVGGLQALQALLVDANLSPESKKNALVILFDIPETDALKLIGTNQSTQAA